MSQFQFNAAQYEPSTGLSPWVDGWHPVILTSVEPKGNQGGQSGRLECVIQAIDGPHKGQNQRFGLNLWHESAQTVEIANRFLSALIYVTLGVNQGRLTINNDTNELCNIPFLIQASRQKDNQNMNDFKAVKDIRGGDPKTGNGAGQVAPVQAPPAGGGFAPPAGGPQFAPPPATGGPASFAPPQQQPQFAPPPQQQQFAPPPATAPAPAAGGWAPPPAGGAPAPAPQQQQQFAPPPQQQQQQFAPPGGAPAGGGWAPPGGAPAQQQAPSWAPPPR